MTPLLPVSLSWGRLSKSHAKPNLQGDVPSVTVVDRRDKKSKNRCPSTSGGTGGSDRIRGPIPFPPGKMRIVIQVKHEKVSNSQIKKNNKMM